MRNEATTEEWKMLYEVATRINEVKPWEYLWDLDIVGIQTGDKPEETVFYSVLGKGGSCIGISIYEGYKAFNSLMLLTTQPILNVSSEYAMFNQKCMSCYWGNREELSTKQREVIKTLGYKYRGKNNWLYFMSYEPGYYPFNLNQNEVIRLTQYLENFEIAFKYYLDNNIEVNFDNANMYSFVISKDRKILKAGEEPLPSCSYDFGDLVITDKDLIAELKKASKGDAVLEMEISPLCASINDKKYDRPTHPMLSVIVDAANGMAVCCMMNKPDEDPFITLAECLITFIYEYGTPREIRVSNEITEAALNQICQICKIKLRRVKKLPEMNTFIKSMRAYGI